MRSRDSLINDFDDIKVLLQYLYMNEKHSIIVENIYGIKLEYTMDENFHITCLNLKTNSPIGAYNSFSSPSQMLELIEYLKSEEPLELNNSAKNRWEEIRIIVKSTVALNELNEANNKITAITN